MTLAIHEDASAFLSAARPLLSAAAPTAVLARAVGLLLSHVCPCASEARWATAKTRKKVTAAVVPVPPGGVLLCGEVSARDAAAIAVDLRSYMPGARAFFGSSASARRVAERWVDAVGGEVEPMRGHQLLRAEVSRLTSADTPGRFRMAAPTDIPVLAEWMVGFCAETSTPEPGDAFAAATALIDADTVGVWEVGDALVACALRAATHNGHAVVGPVFAPPASRRVGFGAAVVTALTAHALAEGAAACWLLGAPNDAALRALYRRAGYEPAAELSEFRVRRALEAAA